jgi:hypothetical protein
MNKHQRPKGIKLIIFLDRTIREEGTKIRSKTFVQILFSKNRCRSLINVCEEDYQYIYIYIYIYDHTLSELVFLYTLMLIDNAADTHTRINIFCLFFR